MAGVFDEPTAMFSVEPTFWVKAPPTPSCAVAAMVVAAPLCVS
jgi:hypothetical protein